MLRARSNPDNTNPNQPQDESYRHILPTVERVMKCSAKVLRGRLKREGVSSRGAKEAMANALVEHISDNMPLEVVVPTTTSSVVTTPTITPTNRDITPTSTATTPTTSAPTVGDTLEVWWEYPTLGWFPCVITARREDVDHTTASLCHYDDERTGRWHNLEVERHRTIPPTKDRLSRLTCSALRTRLRTKFSITATTSLRKSTLVAMAINAANTASSVSPATPVPQAASPTTSAPEAARKRRHSDTSTLSPSTKRVCRVERSKYGQSHTMRRLRIRQRKADREKAAGETPNKRMRVSHDSKTRATPATSKKTNYKTATQAVDTIRDHAQALYTLATKGDRRDDRQTEREGYNLLIFSQRQMCTLDPNAHVWQRGDMDMSLLHPSISECFDTKGWVCVNTYADGDGVVFLRPPPPMLLRGCGAQRRVKQFQWTEQQGIWLQKRTHHLGLKSINFLDLALEAEARWGHSAPKQENIENRIKSREQAKKEGRALPQWTSLWTPPP